MTLAALIKQLQAGQEASVSWSIQPAIGPGWIGGDRSITICVGELELHEGAQARMVLDEALVAQKVIPAGLSDSVLSGEGTLRVENNQLVLDYSWSDTPVYAFGTSGHAVIVLLKLGGL